MPILATLELGSIRDEATRRAFENLIVALSGVTITGGGGGGAPSGPAGGDLGGTYPNPTVTKAQSGFTVGGAAVVLSTDPALTDSRAPNGPAGGDLSGTYPNPGIAAGVIVNADVNAAAAIARSKLDFGSGLVNADIAAAAAIAKTKLASLDIVNADVNAAAAIAESKLNLATDAAAGTGSRRTLGTGATQAAAGNDARFTDSRAPNGTAGGDLAGSYPNPTIALLAVTDGKVAAANKDGAAGTPSMRTLGTGAAQAAAGNDVRLSDARTPTAHQTSHQSGGSDAQTGNLDATARSNISKGGTLIGTRRGLNLIEGTNVTMTVADDVANERVNVTINSAGGGGGVATTFVGMAKWGVD